MTLFPGYRRHRFSVPLGALLLILTAGCSGTVPTGDTRVKPLTSLEDFDAAIAADTGSGLVMVDFYADWCGPCRQLAPVIDALSVAHENEVTVYKVDVDQLRPLLARFRIRAIPYVILFKNGRPVRGLPGVLPPSTYRDAIRAFSAHP